ncbi:hypothetical protein LINPERPRIM_LOCUS31384 [Linum perenne]
MATTGSSKSCRKPPRKNPNASGSRTDPGWQYAVDVDGTAKKTKCKFCLKVYSGGIFRLKHHLAGTRDNVEECVSVPDDVRKKILELLDVHLEAKEAKKNLMSTSNSAASSSSIDTSSFSKNAEKVFEMLDNVVEKVGEENVIQIVTDNGVAYKAAGTKLMEKRKHLFWTPCAAHCLDLMLEDFDKNLKVHKSTIEKGRKITNFIYASAILISMLREFTKGHDLVRPGATRFATTYLTLACLSEHKGPLMTMFSSDSWKKGSYSNIPKGKKVQGIVLDSRFWSNVSLCIRAALPLVKVLRLVDSEEYPSMPFLFFELNQAKEKIKLNFSNNEAR